MVFSKREGIGRERAKPARAMFTTLELARVPSKFPGWFLKLGMHMCLLKFERLNTVSSDGRSPQVGSLGLDSFIWMLGAELSKV